MSNKETNSFLDGLNSGRLTLGQAISSIRICDGISQIDFAKLLGVSPQYLCDLEKDRKEVSPKKAAEFANKLGYPEKVFIIYAIQDSLNRINKHYSVELHEVA